MRFALVNRSQYVTTTDRLLALREVTKRRGPHMLPRACEYTPQNLEYTPQNLERTIYVRGRARNVRYTSLRLLVAAIALLVAGGLATAHLGHAAAAVHAVASR